MTYLTKTNTSTTSIDFPQGRQGFDEPKIGGLKTFDSDIVKSYIEQPLIFVADNSGSMSGAKAVEATQAIKALLEQLADPANKDNFRVSMIKYANQPVLEHSSIPPDQASVEIRGDGGGTQLAPALEMAEEEIASFTYRENKKHGDPVLVVFSDGHLADFDKAMEVADKLKASNAKVIAIGFGSEANEVQLKKIATDADHYSFANVGQLKSLFANVGKTLSMQNQMASA